MRSLLLALALCLTASAAYADVAPSGPSCKCDGTGGLGLFALPALALVLRRR
jgi:hypothetical protein